jgi:hypothetical protein
MYQLICYHNNVSGGFQCCVFEDTVILGPDHQSLCRVLPDVSEEHWEKLSEQSSVTCQENGMHNDAVTDSKNNNRSQHLKVVY